MSEQSELPTTVEAYGSAPPPPTEISTLSDAREALRFANVELPSVLELYQESTQTSSAPARLAKPPHGAPCNFCGQCCLSGTCKTGQKFFGIDKATRCPALAFSEHGIASCGLMENPQKFVPELVKVHGARRMGEAMRVIMASGTGCDARFEGEPRNEAFDRRMDLREKTLRRKINAAYRMWAGRI